MTQIKEGLSKADPKPMLIHMVDVSTPSTDKKPSPELFSLIKAAATNLLGFGELWGSIKKKGHDEGFTEKELQDMLRPFLKEKLDSKKVWYLFHKEEQIERVQKKQEENRTKFSTNDDKNVLPKPEERQYAVQATAPEEIKQLVPDEEEEDPKDLEIAFLKEKVSELEEALKKTVQFQPGIVFLGEKTNEEIQELKDTLKPGKPVAIPEEDISEKLRKQADGIHSFFYDSYGIDLFKNRELPQLKNSGVKVFRRLYFEV